MTDLSNKLLEAAIEYAEAGFKVFPLIPNTKRPATPNGVKDATTDLVKIKHWWAINPVANIGVAMGNGIFALDIDFKDGCRPDFMQRLPPTVVCVSPSGGNHAYFKDLVGGIKNGLVLEKGVTVRSAGYYFCAPPSFFVPEGGATGTSYEWVGKGLGIGEIAECPEWIEELNKKSIDDKKPYELPDELNRGEQNVNLWSYAGKLRASGLESAEILAALRSVAGRCKPLPNDDKLQDIAKRICNYEKGYSGVYENFEATEPDGINEKETLHTEKTRPRFPTKALGPKMEKAALVMAEQIGAPIEMISSSLLAGAAVCVQPFYDINAFGSVRPISLYFVTIAESGERKSTVDRIALAEHYKWKKEKDARYQMEKLEYIKNLEEWNDVKHQKTNNFKPPKPLMPKAPILFMTEPTVEGLFHCLKFHRNSIGLFSDEGGTFLGGHSMKQENTKATLGKLNQLWDGSPIDRIRKGKDDGEIDVLYGKRVSTHLMLQAKLADELFNNEYAKSQGFLARCLTCQPESLIGSRSFLYNIPIPSELNEYNNTVRMFLDMPPVENPSILSPTDGAIELLKDFYDEVEPKQKYGMGLESVRDFASKASEHCIRIAAVLTAFENPSSRIIDGFMMSRAIEIGRFYLDGQVRTTADSNMFSDKVTEALYSFLIRRSVWHLRDILRTGPKKTRVKSVLIQKLKQLEKLNHCTFDEATGIVKT